MMRRAAVKNAQMNIGASSLGEPLKKIFDQLSLKAANQARGEFRFDDTKRAAAEVNRGGGKSLIHGHQKIAGAENAFAIPEGGVDCFTESNTDVFDGVMLIDMEIASRFELEVESAVASDEIEHVVEEGDTGGNA